MSVELEQEANQFVSVNIVEKKLSSLQAWIVAGLTFMFVAAVTFLIVAVVVVLVTTGRVKDAKEKSDEGIACFVLPQLDRQLETLPAAAYYVDHPDELKAALDVVRKQRRLALKTWGSCETFLPS